MAYINRNGKVTLDNWVIKAVKKTFIAMSAGCTGFVKSSRVFRLPRASQQIESGNECNEEIVIIGGVEVH